MNILSILDISLQQGLAYALVVLGVTISFRLLDFPDLTVDGSFTLGGAVVGIVISSGHSPLFGVFAALIAGSMAGATTGILNTKFGINKILAGILAMSVLYTVNLRIMGRPNIPLLNIRTLLTPFENSRLPGNMALIGFYFALVLLSKLLLDLFLCTELGMILRATGDNEQIVCTIGVSTDKIKILGMGLSNSLVALSGALVAQSQGFADIGMGIGMIIIGLASLLIGESFFRSKTVFMLTLAAVTGSIVYQLIMSAGLRLGLAPTDLKLATGLMVIVALSLRSRRKSVRT